MRSEELLDAIGDARDEYIRDAGEPMGKKAMGKRSFFQRSGSMAAALAVVLLLAIPARGELRNGYVSNLLAPLYGNAQTELVDRIGKPIDASATVGDYTLTADAVIGDAYNMAIVYSLTRTDGGEMEEGLSFEEHWNTARRGTGGGSYRYRLSGDKRVLYIVEEWTTASRLWRNRRATSTFTNLMRREEDPEEKILLEEGSWEIKFTLRYEDSSIRVPARNTVVEDASGKAYTIHKILLSPIGMHLDLTGPNRTKYFSHEDNPLTYFTVSLVLKDGTSILVDNRNLASHGNADDDMHRADFGAMFDEPVPLDQIKQLVICGTPFPLGE